MVPAAYSGCTGSPDPALSVSHVLTNNCAAPVSSNRIAVNDWDKNILAFLWHLRLTI